MDRLPATSREHSRREPLTFLVGDALLRALASRGGFDELTRLEFRRKVRAALSAPGRRYADRARSVVEQLAQDAVPAARQSRHELGLYCLSRRAAPRPEGVEDEDFARTVAQDFLLAAPNITPESFSKMVAVAAEEAARRHARVMADFALVSGAPVSSRASACASRIFKGIPEWLPLGRIAPDETFQLAAWSVGAGAPRPERFQETIAYSRAAAALKERAPAIAALKALAEGRALTHAFRVGLAVNEKRVFVPVLTAAKPLPAPFVPNVGFAALVAAIGQSSPDGAAGFWETVARIASASDALGGDSPKPSSGSPTAVETARLAAAESVFCAAFPESAAQSSHVRERPLFPGFGSSVKVHEAAGVRVLSRAMQTEAAKDRVDLGSISARLSADRVVATISRHVSWLCAPEACGKSGGPGTHSVDLPEADAVVMTDPGSPYASSAPSSQRAFLRLVVAAWVGGQDAWGRLGFAEPLARETFLDAASAALWSCVTEFRSWKSGARFRTYGEGEVPFFSFLLKHFRFREFSGDALAARLAYRPSAPAIEPRLSAARAAPVDADALARLVGAAHPIMSLGSGEMSLGTVERASMGDERAALALFREAFRGGVDVFRRVNARLDELAADPSLLVRACERERRTFVRVGKRNAASHRFSITAARLESWAEELSAVDFSGGPDAVRGARFVEVMKTAVNDVNELRPDESGAVVFLDAASKALARILSAVPETAVDMRAEAEEALAAVATMLRRFSDLAAIEAAARAESALRLTEGLPDEEGMLALKDAGERFAKDVVAPLLAVEAWDNGNPAVFNASTRRLALAERALDRIGVFGPARESVKAALSLRNSGRMRKGVPQEGATVLPETAPGASPLSSIVPMRKAAAAELAHAEGLSDYFLSFEEELPYVRRIAEWIDFQSDNRLKFGAAQQFSLRHAYEFRRKLGAAAGRVRDPAPSPASFRPHFESDLRAVFEVLRGRVRAARVLGFAWGAEPYSPDFSRFVRKFTASQALPDLREEDFASFVAGTVENCPRRDEALVDLLVTAFGRRVASFRSSQVSEALCLDGRLPPSSRPLLEPLRAALAAKFPEPWSRACDEAQALAKAANAARAHAGALPPGLSGESAFWIYGLDGPPQGREEPDAT